MRTVGIHTLGCKVNTYESEYIINELKKNGYIIKSFDDICDVYIINTCTVTNNSDSKSKKTIRQAIRRNPDACVVAMGCFIASHMDYKEAGLDIVLANKDKSKIVELLDEYFDKKEQIIDLYDKRLTDFEDMYITSFRGKCRSKDYDTVIKEVTELVNNGYKEVVLTGIHTGSYGIDIDHSFADLLRGLIKIDGLKRLRISSIEVTELNEEVLDIIKNSDVIVDHLHIPIQAGSDEILKAMNRKYNLAFYKEIIDKIRNIRRDIAISTDVIVGFPGEDINLFNKTIDTCREIGFSKLHVFPFSEREGTKAARLSNKLDGKTKKEYANKLIEISKELEINYMKKFINKRLDVLIEEYKDGYSYGHTSNFIYVKIKGEYEHNEFVSVLLKEVEYPYMLGEV